MRVDGLPAVWPLAGALVFGALACGADATTTPGEVPASSGAGGDGAATSSASGGSASSTGAGAASCYEPPPCDAAPPDPGAAADWNDALTPVLVTSQGDPRHRGRDLLLNPGDPQWVLAKFAYGSADKDLKGENVDIYLLRECEGSWESLGSAITTQEDEHDAVEGVDDSGGRLYFEIPAEQALGVGRHRIHLVVEGDLSTTEQFIEVLPEGTPVFVSDVDGTLTTSETEEYGALLTGAIPNANAHAAEALGLLAEKGYRPFYLTARPEWLTERTRAFLAERGFPAGIVHTTLSSTGALGNAAIDYKSGELAVLAERGMVPAWAFGNTDTDAAAYQTVDVEPLEQRVFFAFDDPNGGRRIDDYGELMRELGAMPPADCP